MPSFTPSSSVQMTRSGFMISMSWPAWICAGTHLAGAGRRQHHALRPLAMHAQRKLLDVQHDVGDVLAHAGDAS